MSLPVVAPGPPPTEVQKQYSSARAQETPTTVDLGQAGREQAVGIVPGKNGGQGGESGGIAGAQPEDHGFGQGGIVAIPDLDLAIRWLLNENSSSTLGKTAVLGDCTVCTWSRLTSARLMTAAKSILSPFFFGAKIRLPAASHWEKSLLQASRLD